MASSETGARVSRPSSSATGVATGRVAEPARRPAELERLEVFIGRWITEGETLGTPEAPAMPIVASDTYQWLPGSHFVMHQAYGHIGPVGAGGLEVIGIDPATGQYTTYFFDSQGNASTQTLSYQDGAWFWQGPHARCRGVYSDEGRTFTAHHERSDDGVEWVPSMTVTLRRID